MALQKVGVELEAKQYAPFLQAMERADQAVAGFGAVASQAAGKVDKLDAAARQVKIDDLERKLAGQAQTLGILERELDETAKKYGDASTQADRKRLAIDNLKRSISGNEQALGTHKTALNESIQAQIRAEAAAKELGTATETGTNKVKAGSDKAGDAIKAAARDADTGFKSIARDADTAGQRLDVFGNIAIGALRRVGEGITNLALAGGRELVGFLGDSLSVAGDFEATLNRFGSVTGGAMDDAGLTIDDFSQKFLELGASTSFSAGDAGDAAVELAKGGVDVSTIMGEATEATLNLAAAGELELAPAAEIVAKQLGVWGEDAGGATNVVNKMAQAANASTVDVEGLALGLANVGGTAKTAGVSFDETVQALALIAPGFSSASDAGTSLKTFFSRLLPTTDNAKDAMRDLGLYTDETGSAFYDAKGEFVGMQKATALLNTSTKDLTEEQRLLAFQTIFGQDAIRAAAILSEQGAEGFDAMGASMAGAGTAADQAAKLNTGYNFALESLKGSMETVQIVLGTLLLPTLTAFINEAVIPGVNAVMEFVTALGASDDPMALIVAKLGEGATMLMGWVIDAIPSVIGALAQLGGALIAWVGEQLPGWSAGLAALGQRAALWIAESYPGWLTEAGKFFGGMLQWITDNIPGWTTALLEFGLKAISWIGEQLPALGTELGKFLNAMVKWVVDSLPTWVAELQKMAAAFIQWVTDSLPGLGTNLGAFAGQILAWIVQTAIDVVPELVKLAGKFIAWIVTDVLPKLPGVIIQIAVSIFNFITAVVKNVAPMLKKLAERFYKWVTETVIPNLPGMLLKIWNAISNWVKGVAENIWKKVKVIGEQLIAGITQGVKDAALGLYNAVVGAVSDALGGVADFLGIQSPSTVFRDFIAGNTMAGWIVGIQDGTPPLVRAMIAAADTSTRTAIGNADSGGMTTGKQFAKSYADAFAAGGDDLMLAAASNAAIQSGRAAFVESATGGGTAGNEFADRFRDAADVSISGPVRSSLSDALSRMASGAASQASQGGWLAGSSFASAFQSALGGMDSGSLIDEPSFSGGISLGGGAISPSMPAGYISGGGQSISTSSNQSFSLTYNNVASPPPVPQSYAALAARAG